MPLPLILMLHLFLAIEIICIEIYKRKKGLLFFDFLTIANAFYLLSYAITPIFYLQYADLTLLPDTDYIYSIAALSFFSYQVFLLGWISTGRIKFKVSSVIPAPSLEYKWFKLGIIFLLLTMIMMVPLVLDKGGLAGYLGGALRRYSFDDSEAGGFAFLSRLTNIAPFLTTVFFYFLIQRPVGLSKRVIRTLFFISLSLSLLQIFGGASRGGMIRLFVLLSFVYILVKKKIKLLPAIIITLFAILFISYGKQTFYAVSNYVANGESFNESFTYLDEARSNAISEEDNLIFREFAHPFKSLDAAIRYKNYNNYSYTYFSDFIWAPFRIIPYQYTSIFFERPEPINNLNTELITGVQDSGGIPPGLIASFYYSLGVFGVLIGSFFYGLLGRRANIWLMRMMKTSKIYAVPFAFFAYYYGFFIANGDPNVYIYYFIMPVLFILSLNITKSKDKFSET